MEEDFLSVWESAQHTLDWDAYTGVADEIPAAVKSRAKETVQIFR
jgi:hypothetical protein